MEKQKGQWKKRIRTAAGTLGEIFVPLLPAMVASGLLLGLLDGMASRWPDCAEHSLFLLLHLFANAAFLFLPVLIAFSAAKTFGGNPYLGAVMGMILIHPELLDAWSAAAGAVAPKVRVWFGLYEISLVGYQGHVFPVVLTVAFMCLVERRLHKIVPEALDLLVTPLVTIVLTGYLAFALIGPVFGLLEHGLLRLAERLLQLPFGVGAGIAGGLYAPAVLFGVHPVYHALEIGSLGRDGWNYWMPVAAAATVAQGAACLALGLKTDLARRRAAAIPAAASAFLGVTEPAFFGLNLRFFWVFASGCIGGFFGGLLAGVLRVSANGYGVTGITGILLTPHCAGRYMLVMLVAATVAFMFSWFLYREEGERPAAALDAPRSENGGRKGNDDGTSGNL
ncbi:MAG: PTS transporter subunit EIIC [Lachnospiraceae bacterium]|nr:PTS transporter subunit EIIC [Lachnospiraceae bacterium]